MSHRVLGIIVTAVLSLSGASAWAIEPYFTVADPNTGNLINWASKPQSSGTVICADPMRAPHATIPPSPSDYYPPGLASSGAAPGSPFNRWEPKVCWGLSDGVVRSPSEGRGGSGDDEVGSIKNFCRAAFDSCFSNNEWLDDRITTDPVAKCAEACGSGGNSGCDGGDGGDCARRCKIAFGAMEPGPPENPCLENSTP